MKIKFKKLDQLADIPNYAQAGDAGMDLKAVSLTALAGFWEYGTGLALEIPLGYVGLVFPRSSISKTDHSLRNSVGVIDAGYRGEIKLRMSSPVLGSDCYGIGDRIGQLLILKLPWVEIEEVKELSPTSRGEGGFGSTGK